jgi:hypothetical protein
MKAKLFMFLGLVFLTISLSSCKKGKTVSCDWVGKAEYQQSNDSALK